MQTVRGIYKDGRVELINSPPADVDQIPVLITFLVDEHRQEVDLQTQGIDTENAVDLLRGSDPGKLLFLQALMLKIRAEMGLDCTFGGQKATF